MLAKTVSSRLPEAFRTAKCETRLICRPLWLASYWYLSRSPLSPDTVRHASSASSTRWKTRQSRDTFAREAKVAGLKSRAAFKLLEINDKYRLFKRGDTVVDLGYAPGSWSQVAVNRTQPGGRVVGIDIIPTQPPKGVSTIQGDFLSPEIREEVRKFVQDPLRGRPRQRGQLSRSVEDDGDEGLTEEELEEEGRGLIERERKLDEEAASYAEMEADRKENEGLSQKELDKAEGRVVNVVLSDMMMNTSGMAFRDHAGSMDLCNAALTFCYDTLINGGHFVCKFYQGAEDHALELRMKELFEKVHRIKPDSSRKESKESYFVCLRRRAGIPRDAVLDGNG